ncbi:hypothetical protein [Streptomyces antimycoticus]|uniref:hypothetical protein n=1 Tax=Streptomyces antimycoticus TaxID=68175 RepID=UPI00367924ED
MGGWDILVVALIGLAFYVWGVRSAWRNPTLLEAERELGTTPAGADSEDDERAKADARV